GASELTQCAAVSTQPCWISEPPHDIANVPLLSLMYSTTCHGQAFFSARSPPTMRVDISCSSRAARRSVTAFFLSAAASVAICDSTIAVDSASEASLVMMGLAMLKLFGC